MKDVLLPHLPIDLIVKAFARSPGNEIKSGKFGSPESSAALAANTFGLFLGRSRDLPPLPGLTDVTWPAIEVCLEAQMRFPWRGGLHPWLDVRVETPSHLIGIESKRYEPFRKKKTSGFSQAYWRRVWGNSMSPFENVRDGLNTKTIAFDHLDAAQLVKHAFGLRTEAAERAKKSAVLFYLYAEPKAWPGSYGLAIPAAIHQKHVDEIRTFARMVVGAEVRFISCSYPQLLAAFATSPIADVRTHGVAIAKAFDTSA